MSQSTSNLPPQEPIPNRLQGLVAIVTGAAGNIGFETARRYLLEGAKVTLTDIDGSNLVDVERALSDYVQNSSLKDKNDLILTVAADFTKEEDVQLVVDKTVAFFGRIDIALLCAGISYSSTSILDTDVDQYDKVMQVNCRSAFLGIKHCGRIMKMLGNGGSIVLVSSIAGLRATPGLSAYSASKFALRGLCITAAAELGQFNIRVNTVHPCGVNTPMFNLAWSEERRNNMLSTVPLGRWAEVADVAAVLSFLGSSDARFMTGGALKVDGGSVLN
ncbi:2-5-dichloro-2-5-cyclohexadiene-1-4-diol dehydrogenase [Penicillium angulare]|uniref:2-5-dichloro-2-5-cyclohexadiene-1-4-diol dehydrogenase n=1 Tax=Penicillium angulare TaxID=116970 RepID=UPI002540EF9E|nr:2-5-dichloro-2-5-cyclohexadiene-1-4-diol dehydrogenase [Penicillium angulare]KAJ5273762.1 2-5-dichloro-2-5-cyclohexadiene-1-4-diol dehydrogenase [Penicillium angulare]